VRRWTTQPARQERSGLRRFDSPPTTGCTHEGRSEHLNQPATAAKAMLGQPASYDRLPFFFTDQHDFGREYISHTGPDGFDQVVLRGDSAGGEFIAFWPQEGRVLAGMNVNV
jgi:hypothetical protein